MNILLYKSLRIISLQRNCQVKMYLNLNFSSILSIFPPKRSHQTTRLLPASKCLFPCCLNCLVYKNLRSTWMVQLVKGPASAQVMISPFLSSMHTSRPMLTAQSLEPVSESVSPSLSVPPLLMLCLYLSKININKKIFLMY